MISAITGGAIVVVLAVSRLLRRPKGGYSMPVQYDRMSQYGRGRL